MKDAIVVSGKIFSRFMNNVLKYPFLKFYFWLLVLGMVVGVFDIFQKKHIVAYSIDEIYCLISAFTLYAFIYKKKYFQPLVGKILFWINFVYQLAYAAFEFLPTNTFTKYLSVLSDNNKPDPWWIFILNLVLVVPLLYVIHLLSNGVFLKKNKTNSKKEVSYVEIRTSQWGRFIAVVLSTEVNLIFVYLLLIAFKVINDSYITDSNYVAIALFVATPFIIYLAKLHQKAIKINLLSIKVAVVLFIVMFIIMSFAPKQTQQASGQNNTVTPSVSATSSLSSDDLMNAINKKRKENNVNELRADQSTCDLANVRIAQIDEDGIGINGDKASFDRAMDQAFSSNPDESLDWYVSYATYQATTADAIKTWEKSSDKDLFTNTDYTYGCVVVKDGYAVVITGYNDPKPTSSVAYPTGVDPHDAISL